MLLYSVSGPTIALLRALPGKVYSGLWFDPRSGTTRPTAGAVLTGAGAVIQKPAAEPWLLLLRLGK